MIDEAELDADLAEMQAWAQDIAAMRPADRHGILLAWARTTDVLPFMLAAEPLCYIALEAHRILGAEYRADGPAQAWMRTPYGKGRNAILRALRIAPDEATAYFATYPLRLVQVDEKPWIAAALNCPDPTDLTPHMWIDITDVLLWNPKTSEVRVLGEHRTKFIAPRDPGDRLVIYGEPWAFFRAWVDRRAAIAQQLIDAAANKWARPVNLGDGFPGALVIGDVSKAPIPLDVPIIEAGPGVDPKQISRAIFRRARLPRVQTMQKAA